MRTIKFRGKTLGTNAWVFGNLIQYENRSPEIINKYKFVVKSDTIGQFTGLLDKNGMEIYEGDIVHMGDPRITYVLLWLDCGLKAKQIGAYGSFCGVTYWAETMTIVGNIHDNPELLKNND